MNRLFGPKRGILDFVLQRLTAVVLGIYVIHLVVVIAINDGVSYSSLKVYFSSPYVLVLTSLVAISFIVHAWIGMWTVGTDYLVSRTKGAETPLIRQVYNIVIAIALLSYLIWILYMIWSVA